MKKKHLRLNRRMLAGIAILSFLLPVQAQVLDPSNWSGYVVGSGNTLITDTFRMQSFLKSSTDNWGYTPVKDAAVPEGKKTLRIPIGSSVVFTPFPVGIYKDVVVRVRCAGDKLVPGENLSVRYHKDGESRTQTLFSPQKNDDYFNFRYMQIDQSPSSLEIVTSGPASQTLNGYYLTDSVFAIGKIPRYSLYSGTGDWNDSLRWSHLPPARFRCALVQGNLKVSSHVCCKEVSLGTGKLHIAKGGSLTIDDLLLYQHSIGKEGGMIVEGELIVKNKVSVYYTFPETGKWYFLSFPFDVYAEGIDPRFRLEDSRFSGSGNYFYIQTYDGEKRAASQRASGNWTIVSSDRSSTELPVFEKNKGYLVALDAAATDKTLLFSTKPGDVPGNFGKEGTYSVQVSSFLGTPDDPHYGWSLCGNLLPSPCVLSDLRTDVLWEGPVYIFDGQSYKPYPLEGDYVIPPFTAFFVKVLADMNISVSGGSVPSNPVFLKSDLPLLSVYPEPQNEVVTASSLSHQETKSYLKENVLYLNGLTSSGKIRVSDFLGRILRISSIEEGTTSFPLSLRPGLYIVNIESGSYRARHKCVITR